jgi:DNA-binding NarL/FixJ family response regulator
LRALAPGIALADTLHATLDQAQQREIPLKLVCRDQRLTARQREVAELLALGHTNEAIATALGVSANTTRNHLAKMFTRLGAANRTEFVRLVTLSPA